MPGTDQISIEVAVGKHSEAMQGQVFGAAGTVTAEVIETAEPVTVDDLSSDRRSSQPQVRSGTIGPAVFVPLGLAGSVIGSLSVSRTVGRDRFSARDVEVLQQFATQASVVIEQGRARDELHRLSLLEDQERIARDLHDTVIQRLFATGLSLQGVSRLIREDEPRRRVESAVEELDITVRHIRTVIFDVESGRSNASKASLRRRILDIAREASRPIGFAPQTSFDGPIDAEIDGPIAEDLLGTLREALSNIARHARATTAQIEVRVAQGTATLRITDDGTGIGPSASQGSGMQNMRTRAERHGGHFTVTGSASGTVVEWAVPLTRAR
jgi:signal transduction histidine kinase